jgi:hypothetical protein
VQGSLACRSSKAWDCCASAAARDTEGRYGIADSPSSASRVVHVLPFVAVHVPVGVGLQCVCRRA